MQGTTVQGTDSPPLEGKKSKLKKKLLKPLNMIGNDKDGQPKEKKEKKSRFRRKRGGNEDDDVRRGPVRKKSNAK